MKPTHTRAELEAALRFGSSNATDADLKLLEQHHPNWSYKGAAARILAAHIRRVDEECHAFAMGPKVTESEQGQATLGAHLLRMVRGEDLP